jgi:tetrahydromethanopterin S-methyltransferase subunit B|tara:strand:- start:260 stop:478 length:219 start_codon:yes stop_codon:yes gene_type:complete
MNKEYIQIKDERDLVKDPKSKAVLNTNIEALHAYKRRKQTYAKIEKIDQLEDKVKSIENKIDEVLTTLKKVL